MPSLDRLLEFAKKISSEAFGLVKHQPEPWAEPMMCFRNLQRKVARDGGRAINGWIFLAKAAEFGEYFIATHHAVWLAPNGAFLDVTPFHSNENNHPLSEKGCPYYLIDGDARPATVGAIPIALASKFFPVTNSPVLMAYVKTLTRKEHERCENLYKRHTVGSR